MGVGNQVHTSMEVYTKRTGQSATQKAKSSNQRITYFGSSGVRFGQVGEAGSADSEVVAAAAAAAVLDAVGGPAAAVAAAVELQAVAVGISTAAAAD